MLLRTLAVAAAEQLHAQHGLGMFHHPADARRGDVEQPRGTANAAGDHDGPDDLDLTKRKHVHCNKNLRHRKPASYAPGRARCPAECNMKLRAAEMLVIDGIGSAG